MNATSMQCVWQQPKWLTVDTRSLVALACALFLPLRYRTWLPNLLDDAWPWPWYSSWPPPPLGTLGGAACWTDAPRPRLALLKPTTLPARAVLGVRKGSDPAGTMVLADSAMSLPSSDAMSRRT